VKLNYKSWDDAEYGEINYNQLYISPFYQKELEKNPRRRREAVEYRIDAYWGDKADHFVEFRDKMGNDLFLWLFPFGSTREDRLNTATALKDLINMSEHL
jgi:hypothetical protein